MATSSFSRICRLWRATLEQADSKTRRQWWCCRGAGAHKEFVFGTVGGKGHSAQRAAPPAWQRVAGARTCATGFPLHMRSVVIGDGPCSGHFGWRGRVSADHAPRPSSPCWPACCPWRCGPKASAKPSPATARSSGAAHSLATLRSMARPRGLACRGVLRAVGSGRVGLHCHMAGSLGKKGGRSASRMVVRSLCGRSTVGQRRCCMD